MAVEVGYIRTDPGPIELAYNSFNGNIYVAADNISVINASSGKMIASTPYKSQDGGVAVDATSGNVYITGSDKVTVVNGTSNKVTRTITVGSLLREAAYDPVSRNLYVVDELLDCLHVINTSTWSANGTIGVGTYPVGINLNQANGHLYVTNYGSPGNNITVADPRSGKNITSIVVGAAPLGIASDPARGTVYVGLAATSLNNLTIINGTTNQIVSSTSVPALPNGVAYDGFDGNVYVAINNWSGPPGGSVAVLNGSDGLLIGSIPQRYGAYGIAYDEANRCLYVGDASGGPSSYGVVSVICPGHLHAGLQSSLTSVEAGAPVTFTANATGGLPPFYQHSFSWSFGDGITTSTNSTRETHVFSAPGTYQVNVTATDSGNYTALATVQIIVTPGPQVGAVSASRSSADVGQAVTFTSSASGGTPPYVAFNWSVLPTSCSGTATAALTCSFQSSADYSISVKATDSVGGVSESSSVFVFRVYADPMVDLSSDRSVMDARQRATLTATGALGSGGYTVVNWSGLPLNCLGRGSVVSCYPPQPGTYVVSVSMTDSNGFTAVSTTVTITVNAAFVLRSPTVSPNPSVDQVVTFNASTTGGTTPYNFTWLFGDGQGAVGADVTHVYSEAGNYTVHVMAGDAVGAVNWTSVIVKVTNPSVPPSKGSGNAAGTPAWQAYAVIGGIMVSAAVLALVLLLTPRKGSQIRRV